LKGNKMLAQFASLSLKDQSALLKQLREAHKQARADYKNGRAALKAEKAAIRLEKQQAKALKQEQAIVRAQLRLEKLLAKQVGAVGTKAKKAAKRPSKAVVLTGKEAAHAVA
jgi:1-deoxy-D-xylulose 5-phosphate reductoisomerase